MLRKLMISCGGTGGHFYPGLAVARVFAARGGASRLLLSGIHAEDQKNKAEACQTEAVALPKMPQIKKNPLGFALGMLRGFFAARREFHNFAPDALLLMGSFASLPVWLAALTCGVPVYLHDGNARIGKAN
ncbi:MAG: glycosyltransferase, partial [Victivallaceae bacterium]|nr:glycosyltransferase [Victivallaceae bacterium]